MKKKIFSLVAAVFCVLMCNFCLTGCGNREVWERPQRVKLSLPDTLHVEYINNGELSMYGYCTLVKDGNEYYVKTPTKYYSSNRLEVYEKVDLKNAVELAEPIYGQGYISACWNSYTNSWLLATDESSPWHANDQNNSVYMKGMSWLDYGYGDVNHPYENGVADENGYKHTATQKENETVTIGSNHVECVVWEYEFIGNDIWSKSKYWFDAETNILLKQSSVYPSSQNQSLDADENVGIKATYFSKTVNMQNYLTANNRWPKPDFANYQ